MVNFHQQIGGMDRSQAWQMKCKYTAYLLNAYSRQYVQQTPFESFDVRKHVFCYLLLKHLLNSWESSWHVM